MLCATQVTAVWKTPDSLGGCFGMFNYYIVKNLYCCQNFHNHHTYSLSQTHCFRDWGLDGSLPKGRTAFISSHDCVPSPYCLLICVLWKQRTLSQTPHIHCELKEGRNLKNGFLFLQLHLNRFSDPARVNRPLQSLRRTAVPATDTKQAQLFLFSPTGGA